MLDRTKFITEEPCLDLETYKGTLTRNKSLLVRLKPSLTLTCLLILVHGIAAILVSLLTLTPGIKLVVTVLLIGSFIFYVRKDAQLISRNAVVKIEPFGKSGCYLTTRSGSRMACQISGDTFVASYLTVLILKQEMKLLPLSVVILPDSADPEEFRQLRIWLRWKYVLKR